MKMKCEELMIGDLVYHNNEVVRITGIGQNLVTYIYNHYFDCELTEIEPIPLTEEILVNNGFKRIDTTIGNYALSINVEKPYDENDYNSTREFLRIGTYLPGGYFDGLFEIENKTQDGYASCKRRCKYVNELQHSLRLCGINKEIIIK